MRIYNILYFYISVFYTDTCHKQPLGDVLHSVEICFVTSLFKMMFCERRIYITKLHRSHAQYNNSAINAFMTKSTFFAGPCLNLSASRRLNQPVDINHDETWWPCIGEHIRHFFWKKAFVNTVQLLQEKYLAIPSDKVLIFSTSAGLLLIEPLRTNFSEIWIKIQWFSSK